MPPTIRPDAPTAAGVVGLGADRSTFNPALRVGCKPRAGDDLSIGGARLFVFVVDVGPWGRPARVAVAVEVTAECPSFRFLLIERRCVVLSCQPQVITTRLRKRAKVGSPLAPRLITLTLLMTPSA